MATPAASQNPSWDRRETPHGSTSEGTPCLPTAAPSRHPEGGIAPHSLPGMEFLPHGLLLLLVALGSARRLQHSRIPTGSKARSHSRGILAPCCAGCTSAPLLLECQAGFRLHRELLSIIQDEVRTRGFNKQQVKGKGENWDLLHIGKPSGSLRPPQHSR